MHRKTGKRNQDCLLEVSNPWQKLFHYLMLAIWTIIIVVPLMIVLFTSFKTTDELVFKDIFSLPDSFLNLENYRLFVDRAKIPQAFKNTMFLIVCSVPISLLMAAMASYVLDRFDFRGRKLVGALFSGSVLIPNITTQVAKFTLIRSLGVYNTRWAGVILFTAADIVQIYLFRQFIKNVPRELDESAMIDGASLPTIFFRVVIPQLIPAFATTAILKALSIYNDLFIGYLYMPASELRTVSQTIRLFTTDYGGQWNVISAGVVTILLPTIIVYLFVQKWIVSGLTNGAVKG